MISPYGRQKQSELGKSFCLLDPLAKQSAASIWSSIEQRRDQVYDDDGCRALYRYTRRHTDAVVYACVCGIRRMRPHRIEDITYMCIVAKKRQIENAVRL